jgi:RNA polymerase sigma-70 factor (ECF subfamily)
VTVSVEDWASLVEQARDPSAPLHRQHAGFTRLIEHSAAGAFGLALSLLGDRDDAQDAVQEAITTAWLRLRQLRDPSAFEPWLKTIVARQCARRRRRRTGTADPGARPGAAEPDAGRVDYRDLVSAALAALPEGERQVTVLYYFLGHSQPEIARIMRLKPGTVAKRLHAARLRIRRRLPAIVRRDFVRLSPGQPFIEKVRRGLLDEYVGEYRFERRPDHRVAIVREGAALFSEAGGQRHLLVPGADGSLLTREYDGEGRFRRNRQGKVTHLVYYEFGKRLGVARKVGIS